MGTLERTGAVLTWSGCLCSSWLDFGENEGGEVLIQQPELALGCDSSVQV